MSNGTLAGENARTDREEPKPNKDDAPGLVEQAARAAETRGEEDVADRIRTFAAGDGTGQSIRGPIASSTVWRDCPECGSEWTVWVPTANNGRLECKACGWSEPVDGEPFRTDGGADITEQPIGERPDPETLSIDVLQTEYSDLIDEVDYWEPYEGQEAVWDRSESVWLAIRNKTDVEPPACPECGERRWGQAPGDPVECMTCGRTAYPGLEGRVHRAWGRMLDPDDEADEPEVRTDGGVAVDVASQDAEQEPAGPIPLRTLTGVQRDLLWVAWGLNSPSGQEIKAEYQRHENAGDLTHSRLYPNLDTLVEEGLLNKSQRNRRTNEYDLTADGRDWLRRRQSWTESRGEGGDSQ
jgi:DNA-binding PadR family transcriptional regulator